MTDALINVDGVTGATDLGDGRVVLILDLVRRIRASTRRGTGASASRASRSARHEATTTSCYCRRHDLRAAEPHVAHIEMVEQVTRVPNAPRLVDGVVFSRGAVVPALNLRARFGFETVAYDLRTRLLVVQHQGRTVGLVVDSAREFVAIPEARSSLPTSAHRLERPLSARRRDARRPDDLRPGAGRSTERGRPRRRWRGPRC